MTRKDKELLFKDLCGRLLYGVKVQCGDYLFTFDKDHMGIGLLYADFNRNPLESPKIILSGCYYGEDIKPYLFPLSSMTEENIYQIKDILGEDFEINKDGIIDLIRNRCTSLLYSKLDALFSYFDKNHFDYRGLIEKDLAINAINLNIY